MDTEIIGAIIAAVATIAAAIITVVWRTRHHSSGDTRGEDAHQPIGSGIDEPTQSDSLADANRRLGEMPLDDVPYATPLPQGSRMVHTPSPLFVGRTSKLKELAQILKSETAMGQRTYPKLVQHLRRHTSITVILDWYSPVFPLAG